MVHIPWWLSQSELYHLYIIIIIIIIIIMIIIIIITTTRGSFQQVPTRRIRLSFVERAYWDVCDFFHNFRGLKWIPL